MLAAADPAQPYGAALPWPKRAGAGLPALPAHTSSSSAARPALFVERGGRSIVSLREPDEEWLRAGTRRPRRAREDDARKRLAVERFDGEPVADTRPMPLLLEAGLPRRPAPRSPAALGRRHGRTLRRGRVGAPSVPTASREAPTPPSLPRRSPSRRPRPAHRPTANSSSNPLGSPPRSLRWNERSRWCSTWLVRSEADARLELAVGAVLVEVVELGPDDALVEGERVGNVLDEHDHRNSHLSRRAHRAPCRIRHAELSPGRTHAG